MNPNLFIFGFISRVAAERTLDALVRSGVLLRDFRTGKGGRDCFIISAQHTSWVLELSVKAYLDAYPTTFQEAESIATLAQGFCRGLAYAARQGRRGRKGARAQASAKSAV